MGKYIKTRRVRGIRVPHNKGTKDCATRGLISPPFVVLPMSQHIGAPATPCVKKGDRVFVGTVVGRANGFVSADVHSSVSGTVREVSPFLMPNGARSEAVVIDSDGEFTPEPALRAPEVETAEQLSQAVAASGIVGLGGAGFPTHVKLSPPKNCVIDTLIINGAECEPYITSDFRGIVEEPESIVEGIKLVKRLLRIPRAVIALEDNKPEAAEILRPLLKESGIELLMLPTSYPQGAEKVLIANVTGRAVPVGKLPADAGVVVLNVGTVASIHKYVKTGMPLVSKRVTVDGDAVSEPCNIFVPVGTPVSFLIECCGGYKTPPKKLIMGGPMMGVALYSGDYPVQKNTNAILALSQIELTGTNACIRCARCVDACTMRLSPVEIQTMYETGDLEGANALSVMSCVECGCCTYACPAKRPITQIMRLAKLGIRKAGIK